MRLFSLVLSCYLMLLFAMPCGDSAGMDTCTKQESQSCENQSQDHHNSCSPFCVCACCSQNIQVLVQQLTVLHTLSSYQEINTELMVLFPPDFYEVKWQPPKLS